jgi:hypothetical protein
MTSDPLMTSDPQTPAPAAPSDQTGQAGQAGQGSGQMAELFLAPVRLATYRNLVYLALAFPLGLAYFVFLVTGLSLGLTLTIIWVGLPILALVIAGSWGFARLERTLAIHLLHAEVPPMAPPAAAEPRTFLQQVHATLSNPVTWKGMGFLAVKFPLGLVTFVLLVTSLSTSLALMATPLFYSWQPPQVILWEVDTLWKALACSLVGAASLWISLVLLNVLALGWQQFSRLMLGSPRHLAPAVPATA